MHLDCGAGYLQRPGKVLQFQEGRLLYVRYRSLLEPMSTREKFRLASTN